MKTEAIKAIIGEEVESRIVAGKYGDASRHVTVHGEYLVGDPCYFLNREDDRAVTAAAVLDNDIWNEFSHDWQLFNFRGQPAWMKLCSDGNGPLGHCVDSGMVAIIPMSVVNLEKWNAAN